MKLRVTLTMEFVTDRMEGAEALGEECAKRILEKLRGDGE
jgi:hypothetical protein